MKFLLATMLLLFSITGFSAEKQITLDMKLSIDGKLVSQPRVVTISGETASIESASEDGDGIFIEVTPTLQNKNEVFMKIIVAKLEKGKITILGNPQIISLLGEPVEITQESTDGPKQSMSLAVTATL